MNKYTFHIHGMHCKACVLLIESELKELPNITHVKSSLKNHSVEIIGDFGNKTMEQIAKELTIPLKSHGYTVSVEKQIKIKNWSDFKIAIPVALGFMIVFFILQKFEIVNLIGSGNVTFGTAFMIGIVASLSTCMAIVGGLVLSMSANFAKEGDKVRPQILFHIGRLFSFFILGGVIGAIGSAFELGIYRTFILGIIVGIVMLILGINLLDIFHFTKKIQPTIPRFISRHILGIKKINHTLTPLLLGIVTFFLPCGFTQSMQIYTLSTGSFWIGAMTMFAFALGTLPVLSALSFSSFSIHNSSKSGIFFKTSGIIVILFALFNITNAFVGAGIISPVFNLNSNNVKDNVYIQDEKQVIEIMAKGGYSPSEIKARSGIPTIIRIKTQDSYDCSIAVSIPSINYRKNLPPTAVTDIEIPTQRLGSTLQGLCAMGMYNFSIDFD